MRDFSANHEALSINTATLRKQWPLDRIIEECARRNIRAISPWRDQVAAVGIKAIAQHLQRTGIRLGKAIVPPCEEDCPKPIPAPGAGSLLA